MGRILNDRHRPFLAVVLASLFATIALSLPVQADDEAAETIVIEQEQLADKFRRFEDVLLRMAEMTAESDPERAALLRRVVAQSKDRLVGLQFERLVELLGQGRLAVATENQQELRQDLQSLLELLLSEDRARRLESEQARLRAALKEVNQLIKQQRALRGETDRGGSEQRLADRQGELAERTDKLAKDLKSHEEGGEESPEDENSDQPAEGEKPSDAQGGEQGDKPSDPHESESQPGDPQEGAPPDGEQSEPQPGSQQQGSPQGGQQQSSNQQVPARERLEDAQKRMREAEQELEEARRDQALERQEAALRELERAKAHLEEVLRQLREEEIERMLAMLEARFRKMLKLQIEIYEGTRLLDAIPAQRRDRSTEVQSAKLSREESQLVVDADKVLTLLREEGTAVALPEAVEQMREDMQTVVEKLATTNVGEITQSIEQDIITALEEMIAAVEQAQQEQEEQQQQQPAPPGEPEDPALIDQLAELKMIRALQMRVNRRTERYRQLIDGEQAEATELLEALDELAQREDRIFRATRDIAIGRNR